MIQEVGWGAFGTVYKARDPGLDRVVAVKVPRSGSLAGREDRARFIREARSAAQLRHPSIVPVHEVGHEDGLPYVVSQFVEGMTLADVLASRRLATREAASLIADLADALHYAHEQGVVHRDVKPSNIMLDSDGRPHLMDFGMAKRDAGDATITVQGQVLGTPAYMAPEQARGEGDKVDRRSDLYSLGVVLYLALTGELPFRGKSKMMLLHQSQHDEPKPPRHLDASIPRDLETVCLKTMAKDPNRRYQSAADLSEDLRRFLGGRAVLARPVGRHERLGRWARRNPHISGLAIACAFLSAAVLILLVLAALREGDLRAASRRAERVARDRAEIEARSARTQEANLYLRAIALAAAERAGGDVVRSESILDGCPDGLRRWEWYFLKRLCRGGKTLSFSDHGAAAVGVALGPRGRLASAGREGTVIIRDLAAGRVLLTLNSAVKPLNAVAFGPDGLRIAVMSDRDGLELRDATSGGRLPTPVDCHVPLTSAAYSPDSGRLAAAGRDGRIWIWDAGSGTTKAVLQGHAGAVTGLAFSADGRWLATSSEDRTVRVWSLTTGKTQLTLSGHRDGVTGVAFSPDCTGLASSSMDGTARIWNAATGEPERILLGHTGPVNGVMYSADGQRIATAGSDKTVKLWIPKMGEESLTLRGHTGRVLGVAFDGDGYRIASADESGQVRIWDATPSADNRSETPQGVTESDGKKSHAKKK